MPLLLFCIFEFRGYSNMRFTIRQHGRDRTLVVIGEALATLRDISHSCPLDVIELWACDTIRARAKGGQIIENNYEYPFDYSPSSPVPETVLKAFEWRNLICDESDSRDKVNVLARLERHIPHVHSDHLLAGKIHGLAARLHVAELGYRHSPDQTRYRIHAFRVISRTAARLLYKDGQPDRYAMALLYARGYRCHVRPTGEIEIDNRIETLVIRKPKVIGEAHASA